MTSPDLPPRAPTIDEQAIATFCEVVFGYLDGFVPVRFLSETGTLSKPPKQCFSPCGDLVATLAKAAALAAKDQRAVFVVPGTVARQGSARSEDIRQTCVILADLDHGDVQAKRDHAARHLGPPSLEVASGGTTESGHDKLHLYWRLSEAAEGGDLEQVRAAREMLALKLGADTSFKSLHQPIRVAGTLHGKNGVLAPVKIISRTPREYELAELSATLRDMPELQGHALAIDTGTPRMTGPDARKLAVTPIRAGGADEITRFEAVSKVIGHWLRNVRRKDASLKEAWQAVCDHNAAMIAPPWDETRLRREFDALIRRDQRNHGPFPATPKDHDGADEPAPEYSDDALAESFATEEGACWKHVRAWGSWFHWTGQVWRRDETGGAREAMRRVCRKAALSTSKPNEARRLASDKTMVAALRVAGCDPRIAARSSDWDAHPMLLNTPAGVIDLETGEVLDHRAALMMTQITAAAPEGNCPRWMRFIAEVTGGNDALSAYLARLAGYCLTGSTREQVFVFLHGHGANGKSVFLNTIAHVLGDYAATSTLETFMASRTSRHLTELAGLRAARLVLVPETEAGHSWAEARIKAVTGGEKIRANFMRQDHFEYTPQFKLLIAGNHRPQITGQGEAMRRRLHLVPFEVTIPPEDRDPDLGKHLRAEKNGILGWMLEGCAEWQRVGLAPPDCMQRAAEEYLESEDLVGQWVAECCIEGPDQLAQSKALYLSWKGWTEAIGGAPGSPKSFGEAMRQRGYRSTTVHRARGWRGVSLRHPCDDTGAGT